MSWWLWFWKARFRPGSTATTRWILFEFCRKMFQQIFGGIRRWIFLEQHLWIFADTVLLQQKLTVIRSRWLKFIASEPNQRATSFDSNTTCHPHCVTGYKSENMNCLQVLFSQDVDQRNVTFERALGMAESYQRRARMLILRSAILKNDVAIKPSNSRGGGGAGHQDAFIAAPN